MLKIHRFSNKFEIRIYDSPGYIVLPIAPKTHLYRRVGQAGIALFLLMILALFGMVKIGTETVIVRIRHNIELFYMLIPALTVIVSIISEDSLKYLHRVIL